MTLRQKLDHARELAERINRAAKAVLRGSSGEGAAAAQNSAYGRSQNSTFVVTRHAVRTRVRWLVEGGSLDLRKPPSENQELALARL